MAMPCVLHGEFMQPKLLLQSIQFFRTRIANCNPDEAVGALHIIADLLQADVCQLQTFLICDTIDEHADRLPMVSVFLSTVNEATHLRPGSGAVSRARCPDSGWHGACRKRRTPKGCKASSQGFSE